MVRPKSPTEETWWPIFKISKSPSTEVSEGSYSFRDYRLPTTEFYTTSPHSRKFGLLTSLSICLPSSERPEKPEKPLFIRILLSIHIYKPTKFGVKQVATVF